jgi:cytochrome c
VKKLLTIAVALILAGCSGSDQDEKPAADDTAGGDSDAAKAEVAESNPAAPLDAETLFLACAACHNIERGQPHKVGPNLHGIAGQPAGTRPGFAYSEALLRAGAEGGLSWELGTMMAWIVHAEAMVPGSWMLYHNTLSVEETRRLAEYVLQRAGRHVAQTD